MVLESSQLSTNRLNQSDGDQVQESAAHRKVRNIGAPDLVGPLDGEAAQQIRIDLVSWCGAAQIGFRINGFDAQNAHQPLDALAVDSQRHRHAAAAEERAVQIQFVQSPEQTQVLLALRPRLIVVAGAWQAEQLALPQDAQLGMLRVDPSAAVFNRGGQLFF
jgi:hypothetical protein